MNKEYTKAWYCSECGRMEDNSEYKCPECSTKRQRVSRYEWFFSDALGDYLFEADRNYIITEQWPILDHRGFYWYFDILVTVYGEYGINCVIEIDGVDHQKQKKQTVCKMTRDEDKQYEFYNQNYHKNRYYILRVNNDDCRLKIVKNTAKKIGDRLILGADNYWYGE